MKDADLPERVRHSIAHDERDALPFMRETTNDPPSTPDAVLRILLERAPAILTDGELAAVRHFAFPPPILLATMRECVNANALACLAELRGAALAVLANSSPTPAKLLRLAKACEASAWVDA